MNRLARYAFWMTLAAILILALLPNPPTSIDTGWDKSNHVLAFFVITILGLQAYANTGKILLGLLAYGLLIEVLQAMTSYRSGDWRDLCADCIGIALGLGTHRLISATFCKHRMRR